MDHGHNPLASKDLTSNVLPTIVGPEYLVNIVKDPSYVHGEAYLPLGKAFRSQEELDNFKRLWRGAFFDPQEGSLLAYVSMLADKKIRAQTMKEKFFHVVKTFGPLLKAQPTALIPRLVLGPKALSDAGLEGELCSAAHILTLPSLLIGRGLPDYAALGEQIMPLLSQNRAIAPMLPDLVTLALAFKG